MTGGGSSAVDFICLASFGSWYRCTDTYRLACLFSIVFFTPGKAQSLCLGVKGEETKITTESSLVAPLTSRQLWVSFSHANFEGLHRSWPSSQMSKRTTVTTTLGWRRIEDLGTLSLPWHFLKCPVCGLPAEKAIAFSRARTTPRFDSPSRAYLLPLLSAAAAAAAVPA